MRALVRILVMAYLMHVGAAPSWVRHLLQPLLPVQVVREEGTNPKAHSAIGVTRKEVQIETMGRGDRW